MSTDTQMAGEWPTETCGAERFIKGMRVRLSAEGKLRGLHIGRPPVPEADPSRGVVTSAMDCCCPNIRILRAGYKEKKTYHNSLWEPDPDFSIGLSEDEIAILVELDAGGRITAPMYEACYHLEYGDDSSYAPEDGPRRLSTAEVIGLIRKGYIGHIDGHLRLTDRGGVMLDHAFGFIGDAELYAIHAD